MASGRGAGAGREVVRQGGLEPPTHGLEGRCSIHLSYWRTKTERGFFVNEPTLTVKEETGFCKP
jgi:hypothetical protein